MQFVFGSCVRKQSKQGMRNLLFRFGSFLLLSLTQHVLGCANVEAHALPLAHRFAREPPWWSRAKASSKRQCKADALHRRLRKWHNYRLSSRPPLPALLDAQGRLAASARTSVISMPF